MVDTVMAPNTTLTVQYNGSDLLMNMTTNNQSLELYEDTTHQEIHAGGNNFMLIVVNTVIVLFALITVLGFLGNTLVILVVALNKTMRTPTNMLVLNLAVADLSFILICVPFTAIKYSTPNWIFGDTWCRIISYMTIVCAWASAYTLVLMCLDRLFAVVFAIRLPNIRSRRNVLIAIVVMWVAVFLVNIPAWMYHGEVHFRGMVYCQYLTKQIDKMTTQVFQLTYFVFGFMLPVIVICILYGILLCFLLNRNVPGSAKSGKHGLSKAKRRVTVMVIAVVSVFVICWLPIQVILVMSNVGTYPQSPTHVAVQIAANCLAYMNSCMNPVLYTISSTAFRKAFKEFLCCKTCPRKRSRNLPQRNNGKLFPKNTLHTDVERSVTHIKKNGAHQEHSENSEETTPFISVNDQVPNTATSTLK